MDCCLKKQRSHVNQIKEKAMPCSSRKNKDPRYDNVIPLFQDLPSDCQPMETADSEAFCIRTADLFYLSVLTPDREKEAHGRGYAVFSTGEKVQFTIKGNGDGTVRERCIRAGEKIARQFKADLEYGRISSLGKFIPD